jgi:hypothetical protein
MKVEEAITHHWGERCDDYEEGCPVCDAWHEYDALPNHERKPLTDEQIDAIVVDEVGLDADADEMHNFARAIEAAHGIKGEA